MSPSRDHTKDEPQVATWLGRYLGLTIFATGLVSGGLGMLVEAVIGWSNVQNELHTHQGLLDAYAKQQQVFEKGMVDVDRRLNKGALDLVDSERRSHDENQALHEQIAITNARTELFGARTIPPQNLGGK